MSVEGGPNIIEEGLVFYVDAANPRSYVSGSLDTFDLNNLSSTNTGSLLNGIDVNYSEAHGVWNLDGVDDQIEWKNIDSSNPLSFYGQNEFTGYYWAKPEASGDDFQRIIDKSDSGNGINGWCLLVGGDPAGTHSIYFLIDNTVVLLYAGTDGYTYGEWNQITITKNGSTNKFYLNGNLKHTQTTTKSFPSTTTDMTIGTWPYSTGREFKGEIGPIILHNKELTATEVLQNYNALKHRFT